MPSLTLPACLLAGLDNLRDAASDTIYQYLRDHTQAPQPLSPKLIPTED